MGADDQKLHRIAARLSGTEPLRIGAHPRADGCDFSVYAPYAEKVELCLFDESGQQQTGCLPMPECTHGLWHGHLPGVRAGQRYGYRISGRYEPKRGFRFNPSKLLIDPYARELAGTLRWHDALHGYQVGSRKSDLSLSHEDSAPYVPKAVITDESFDWGQDAPPRTPWADTVIYEAHVKGLTQRHPQVPEAERGRFRALGHPAVTGYLRELGVTALELLPVHAFLHDRLLVERGLRNYWGYNTLCYFAPHPEYGTRDDLKWAIRELHRAGLEVILDVVYNHTCEGNELGTTLSWRGFANASYYRLAADGRHHINDTGCGNTLNFAHPRVIQMTLDSLRHWVEHYHVDGFRFDLGVSLGRETYGFDPNSGFFDALLQDPVLSRVKLISEPWDIGPGGYQLGHHPPGFAEWNGHFRDDLRRYWKGDAGLRGALAARVQGSADLFDHQHRRPWASVNFITAHDGFTLHDLVSYNEKHNEANGEENRDGAADNQSCNWGAEGPTEDAAILAQRAKTIRNFAASLLTSFGTPMLLAGDEFGQTQNGNNNAYCQDNELSWLDWARAESAQGRAQRAFFTRLLRLHRELPLLKGVAYQHAKGELLPGLRDLFWFDERGVTLSAEDWNNPKARLLGVRRAARRGEHEVDLLMLLYNADGAEHEFQLPQPVRGLKRLIDTDQPDAGEFILEEPRCPIAPHSLQLIAGTVRAADFPAPAA